MLRYVTPIKRIRERRVSAHLLIYSLLFFKLLLGLDVEFGYSCRINARIRARFRVWVRFRVRTRTRITIF